jgi:hypothetical protein
MARVEKNLCRVAEHLYLMRRQRTATVDLNVPFHEKDRVKNLGAMWSPDRKTWFIPIARNFARFERWLPPKPEFSIRATRYFINKDSQTCWSCGRATTVFALSVPAGHQVLVPVDEDDLPFTDLCDYELWRNSAASVQWLVSRSPSYLAYVEDLLPEVGRALETTVPMLYRDYSKQADMKYWMNHCEHCRAKQGDWNLHNEPGGAFSHLTEDVHDIWQCFDAMIYANASSTTDF